MWGMKGLTALSPCWEGEGNSGQVAVTALTRRHGYTRGHDMGLDGFTTNLAGRNVWFVTTKNTLAEVTVARSVVRTRGTSQRDYTILLFSQDLPPSIEPLRVMALANVMAKYPVCRGAPWPIFSTEQGGNVSAGVNGFVVNTWKGGDSGSPDMLPMPGELGVSRWPFHFRPEPGNAVGYGHTLPDGEVGPDELPDAVGGCGGLSDLRTPVSGDRKFPCPRRSG